MSNILPEIIFSSSDTYTSRQISKLMKNGQLRKLLPKVYTSNHIETDEVIIKKNLWKILSNVFPGALLSHRSALEFTPSPQKNLYLTGKNRRVYRWPGVTIRITDGPIPENDDYPLFEQLHASSIERAMLENLMPSRKIEGERRTLDQSKIEEKLLIELNTKGEAGLNNLRDRAREIAEKFGWKNAFDKLNRLISSLLVSRPGDILKSPLAVAKILGEPYDSGRMELFQKLVVALKTTSFADFPQKTDEAEAFSLIAFFESYFSNYIEGTTFKIEEAKEIIYNGMIIPNRTGDRHDIIGTYQIVQDRFEMNRIPSTTEGFLDLLQVRHQMILGGRKEKNPGVFKTVANRAGNSFFVIPEMVKGTLKNGFKLLNGLTNPIRRAFFVMFLISEVHPFDDGNGRIARIMMNAELVHAKQSKLIIPTVYRDDYILNLKRLTRKSEPQGFIRMMTKALQFSHWLEPLNFDQLLIQLKSSNAFLESDEAALRFSI